MLTSRLPRIGLSRVLLGIVAFDDDRDIRDGDGDTILCETVTNGISS